MPPFAFWNKRERGRQGEDDALAYLLLQGLVLLQRNYLCKGGELDLIMRDDRDGTLVFVEVRLRSDSDHGGAAASIGRGKQQRCIRGARHYLMQVNPWPPCRFDVVAIDGDALEWIVAAFDTSA